jgi:hypothetical protein
VGSGGITAMAAGIDGATTSQPTPREFPIARIFAMRSIGH